MPASTGSTNKKAPIILLEDEDEDDDAAEDHLALPSNPPPETSTGRELAPHILKQGDLEYDGGFYFRKVNAN